MGFLEVVADEGDRFPEVTRRSGGDAGDRNAVDGSGRFLRLVGGERHEARAGRIWQRRGIPACTLQPGPGPGTAQPALLSTSE